MFGPVQRLAVACAVAALAATACATTTQGSPHLAAALSSPHFPNSSPSPAASFPSTSTAAPSTAAPQSSSAMPPSAAPPSATAATGALPAITVVHFRQPPGFVKSTGLRLVDPITPSYQAEFLAPGNEASGHNDALAVVLYHLPAGSRPVTPTAQRAFIQQYNDGHQVSVTDGVRPHDVGGYPGFSELADQPPDYHYLGYFVFGRSQLVSITCQYDLHPSLVMGACARLMGSVRFTG